MSMRFIAIILLIFTLNSLMAQSHEPVFPFLEGEELIDKLQEEFRPFSVLSYKDARNLLYRELFNKNDSVACVYTGHKVFLDGKTGDPIAYLYRNGDPNGINCEHSFPQSFGAGEGNARSDLHHLYPTRIAVNQIRSNLPFGEIPDDQTQKWYWLDRDQNNIPGMNIDEYSEYRNDLFEPREDHKGDLARALFYFASIYKDQADTSWFLSQRSTLCEWHGLDPVDEDEWNRNNRIAEVQSGKRNPFVLDCTLAYRSFCKELPACQPQTHTREKTATTIQFFPADGSGLNWTLITDKGTSVTVNLINITGKQVHSSQFQVQQGENLLTMDWTSLRPGWYVIELLDAERGVRIVSRPVIL